MSDAMAAAVDAARDGRPAILVNELRAVGVLAMPVSALTDDHITFMVTECRGILYAAVPAGRLAALDIPCQPATRGGPSHIHVPVDLAEGTTTGVSSTDRCRTIKALADPSTQSGDFQVPGHVVPMATDPAGIVGRLGLAETAQEVAVAADAGPTVAFCGVMDTEGLMARPQQLAAFAARWQLPRLAIADALATRRLRDGWDAFPASDTLHLPYAGMRVHVRAVGAEQVRQALPTAVLPLCARGHALRDCSCLQPTRAVTEILDAGQVGAAVAVQRLEREATCADDLSPQERDAIARIVAADQAAAHPAPFPTPVPAGVTT